MPRTFADVLTEQLRGDGSRPFVTFYDDATGERVELSLTTYANWVAKTAGLVQDDLDGERGGLVVVDLPTHWLGAVWLGAAWTLGLVVTDDGGRAGEADLVVCAPDGVPAYAERAASVPVVALSLRPLGGRFLEPLPTGVVDYGAVVLAQPDVFLPLDPPSPHDPAWSGPDGTSSQAQLLASAERSEVVTTGERLLTDVSATSRPGVETLLAPLVHGGGTVWVRHPVAERWDVLARQERADRQLHS